MKFSDFLNESSKFNMIEKFIIQSWGSLLYLSYSFLNNGPDNSDSPELKKLVNEYNNTVDEGDEEEIEESDEWISDGMSVNGKKILNKNTIDSVFESASISLKKPITLYRTAASHKLKSGSWVSMTSKQGDYSHLDGTEKEYLLPAGSKVIDTDGLCDNNEYIVSTDVLLDL